MRKLFLVAIIISFFSMGSTCRKNRPDCHVYYTIKNNSNGAIYFGWNQDSSLSLLSYPPGVSPAEYKCEANETKKDNRRGCYETEISFSPTQTLTIWILMPV